MIKNHTSLLTIFYKRIVQLKLYNACSLPANENPNIAGTITQMVAKKVWN